MKILSQLSIFIASLSQRCLVVLEADRLRGELLKHNCPSVPTGPGRQLGSCSETRNQGRVAPQTRTSSSIHSTPSHETCWRALASLDLNFPRTSYLCSIKNTQGGPAECITRRAQHGECTLYFQTVSSLHIVMVFQSQYMPHQEREGRDADRKEEGERQEEDWVDKQR